MVITSLIKQKNTSSSLPWPSCKLPKTDSFRICNRVFRLIGSIYTDHLDESVATSESWFTTSSECETYLAVFEDSMADKDIEEPLESVMRGASSERFFLEPDEIKWIVEERKGVVGIPVGESVVLAMVSKDPYWDFWTAMEEMVEAYGLREWECLDEMLEWYLEVNGKNAHGFIVEAFVDLLVGIVSSSIDQAT